MAAAGVVVRAAGCGGRRGDGTVVAVVVHVVSARAGRTGRVEGDWRVRGQCLRVSAWRGRHELERSGRAHQRFFA